MSDFFSSLNCKKEGIIFCNVSHFFQQLCFCEKMCFGKWVTMFCFSFSPGKASTYPELDEQIDFLSAMISEQRTESVVPGTVQISATLFAQLHLCFFLIFNIFFCILVPSFQDSSLKLLSEPNDTNRGPPTEQSTSPSTTPTSTTTPTTNHTPGLLRDPVIIPYPSNDFVFISKSFLVVTTR